MPFSGGGGSGQLPNHEHSSVPLDGGPLDLANVTIGSLNAGSTTFSDGAALQELVIGTPAQAMVVNGAGTAPEWATAGGGGIWEFVEEFINPSTQVYFNSTLTSAIDLADYNVMCQWWLKNDAISSNMQMNVNGDIVYLNGNTATSGLTVSGLVQIPADSWCIGSWIYYGNTLDTTQTMGFLDCSHGTTSSGNLSGTPYKATFRLNVATTQITDIEIYPTNGNQYIGNIVRFYRMKVD